MTRIDHTGHDHPATPAGRAACRKLTGGLRVADMIQIRMSGHLVWGVILHINYTTGEFKTRFSDTVTLYVPTSEIVAGEKRVS